MNHAITVGGLVLGIGAIIGLLMIAFGLLATFAAGMSDSPEASSDANRTGCTFLLFGVPIFGACLWGLFT